MVKPAPFKKEALRRSLADLSKGVYMMKKLNPIVYQKLLLQAEEAKDREMIKLASGIL